jgi:hypothetical protein
MVGPGDRIIMYLRWDECVKSMPDTCIIFQIILSLKCDVYLFYWFKYKWKSEVEKLASRGRHKRWDVALILEVIKRHIWAFSLYWGISGVNDLSNCSFLHLWYSWKFITWTSNALYTIIFPNNSAFTILYFFIYTEYMVHIHSCHRDHSDWHIYSRSLGLWIRPSGLLQLSTPKTVIDIDSTPQNVDWPTARP